jgi:hypothetical protein
MTARTDNLAPSVLKRQRISLAQEGFESYRSFIQP